MWSVQWHVLIEQGLVVNMWSVFGFIILQKMSPNLTHCGLVMPYGEVHFHGYNIGLSTQSWQHHWATMTWWRHQMETFSMSLAICAGNSPVPSEFPAQRPVTRSFVVFFDQCLNKRLSKQSWGWWFEMPSRPSWRHRNGIKNLWTSPICFKLLTSQMIPIGYWFCEAAN